MKLKVVIGALFACFPVASYGQTWTVLSQDNFESGWGNFISGGRDADRYTDSDYAHQGNAAIELQDNSGAESSMVLSNFLDVANYNQLNVHFWFIGDSMDEGEDFMIEYQSDRSSTWTMIKSWAADTDFFNDEFYEEDVLIPVADIDGVKIRFRCDAGSNSDKTYIDEVEISGSSSGSFPPPPPTPVTPPPPPTPLTPPPNQNYDPFGVRTLYASDPNKLNNDWFSFWDRSSPTEFDRAGQVDPEDERCFMKGSGEIEIFDGECFLEGRVPRFYILKESGEEGYENVEFTAYGKYIRRTGNKKYSGLTMYARTNHGDFDDGCTGAGYLARIYENSGEVAFQKEYFHGGDTIYASSVRTDFFSGGLPEDVWIGMKYVVYTRADGSVQLELWIDETDGANGGNWVLAHSYVDQQGEWLSKDDPPSRCDVQNGDPVVGARKHCILRGDDSEIAWKKASIRNISPERM